MWRSAKLLRAAKPHEEGAYFGLCEVNNACARRIADVHFALDYISMEVVAHELTHALVQRISIHGPDPTAIILQASDGQGLFGRAPKYFGGRADEEVAYEMGRWVHFAYSWAYDTWRKSRGRKPHG